MNHYEKLKALFKSLSHLQYAQKILGWDEAVMMPEGAGSYRAQALGTFDQIIQKKLTSKKMAALIEATKNEPLASEWDRANFKWIEEQHKLAQCIPLKLSAKLTEAQFASVQAWRKLRAENNWSAYQPYLQTIFNLKQEVADRKSQLLQCSAYDALINDYIPAGTQKDFDEIFAPVQKNLPPLRQSIIEKQAKEPKITQSLALPIPLQKELALCTLKAMQFDFDHGRLDVSHHPFCDGVSTDVRITTRYNENDFLQSLFGSIHEGGHALYDQGVPLDWMTQPVGQPQCMGLHESQSLLFEYQVCQSPAFFKWIAEQISAISDKTIEFSAQALYSVSTRVSNTLIRVDSDPVSYPLHVILRYEIEQALFKDEIKIADLPDVWNEKMMRYLNISTRGNDKDGVMQDVHWPSGDFGYFPAYLLGQIISAQLYAKFLETTPDFENHLQTADFKPLHQWLQKHFYAYGAVYSYKDLAKKASGEAMNAEYLLNRIKMRYWDGI